VQINAFYLQKEAELQLRLETLLSKRRAAVTRSLPDNALSEGSGEDAPTNVEWSAVEEGFRLLERDLNKLQVGFLNFAKLSSSHSYTSHCLAIR
jgi:CDK inhibitor PHO81